MSFDTFEEEQGVIEKGDALLVDSAAREFRGAYEELLQDYKKLFKVSRRLVRMSDRSEERLKTANDRIKSQQIELEKAHHNLSLHAEALEDKVRERTKELVATQGKLERLVGLGIALSKERNQVHLMKLILQGAKELTNADGGMLFLRDDADRLRHEIISIDTLEMHLGAGYEQEISRPPILMRDLETDRPAYFNPVAHAALTERTVNVANSYESRDFDFSSWHDLDRERQYRSLSFLAVPMMPRQGEVSGVLLLLNAHKPGTGHIVPFSSEVAEFVEALTAQAAVALDNKKLLKAQELLLDSIIKLTASAIDAKSPYTGGHCARVPEIGHLLARAACDMEEGVFADFDMNEDEWKEFRLSAWLHDCGKVTTPEYVVDKATKLETINNRIHEIRTRFEVLRRDRIIGYQAALLEGKRDPTELKMELDETLTQLQKDFVFIAECNVGEEHMTPDRIERLEQIGKITWERFFDDRLGLSHMESLRLERIPQARLPATERLLDDKKTHVFPRTEDGGSEHLDAYGIKLKPPKHLYNAGELHNLRVSRGTLTEEERFKINEHVIQSIIMLEQLPFPKNLSRVPEFAGGHHETMIGTGYPRKLRMEGRPVQARILAIADIFEALTASDRPYKKAKTLSQALHIMNHMRNEGHIDPDLFELFLTSGVYRVYSEQFLQQEQIDEVDVSQLLGSP